MNSGRRSTAQRRVTAAGRALVFAGLVALAGCQADEVGYGPKHLRPIASATQVKMKQLDMSASSPILVRLYKEESTLEVWKQARTGKFELLQSYEICKWSGGLGPKVKEGDRQAPEGFYTITPGLMNPNSSYHLSFNLGFPNAYDRSYGRTGSHLMVHGSCSSRGCYAMEDAQIQDIYALARESFRGGQRSFQVQAFPFRMTPENLARHEGDPNMPFWLMLKEGSDHFEVTRQEPKVDVCGRQYVFNSAPVDPKAKLDPSRACPMLDVPQEILIAVASKRSADTEKTRQIVASLAAKKQRQEENTARSIEIASAQTARGKALDSDAVPAIPAAVPATGTPADGATTPADATQIMIASVPVPQAAPGRAPATMVAAAPAEKADTGNFFTSMFSFAGTDAPATAAPATPAVAAPAAPEAAAPAAIAAADPAQTPAPAPGTPTAQAVAAVAPEAAEPAAAPAPAALEAPAVAAVQPAAVATASPAPVAATPPVPAADPNAPLAITPPAEPVEKKSFFAKTFGSLFATN